MPATLRLSQREGRDQNIYSHLNIMICVAKTDARTFSGVDGIRGELAGRSGETGEIRFR